MRPSFVTAVLLVLASPFALAEDVPPRFDVDVTITGGDVVLKVDVCGHGPGTIDLVGIDYGDPENLPIVLREETDAHACAGDGYRYRNVIAEGALTPPVHCYRLDVAFTTGTDRLFESAYDCG